MENSGSETESGIQNGPASNNKDEESEEVPTLKSIAEGIRKNKLTKNDGKDEEEEEDGDFASKPAKIFKLTDGRNQAGGAGEQDEEEKQKSKSLMVMSQQELRTQLFKLLKKFFKCAFTIIIRKRKLSPSDAFEMTRVLGVSVPRFLHPSSLEYVEEVAKKLVLFLHRNSSEGCAIHIMIEKNKTLYVVQRFVFRTMGSLDTPENEDETLGIDLDEVKANCRNSLLQLLSSDSIRPMTAPQYSRWSISIGLKKELIVQEELEQLWSNDPSGNYFPWKKRFRSLANIQKNDNDKTALPVSRVVINRNDDAGNVVQTGGNAETTLDCQIKNPEPPTNLERAIVPCTEKESTQISHLDRPPTNHDDSKQSHTESNNDNDEMNKIICFPLSSFAITSNFMMSIYGLEYPATVNSTVSSSTFSPRISRSSTISVRASQLRHKLLRQSSNKF